MNRYIILTIVLLGGCIFRDNSDKEKRLKDAYYLSSDGGDYTLIKKEEGAQTSKVITSTGIDSIGWNDSTIFGRSGSAFFIVYTDREDSISVSNDRSLMFEKSKLTSVNAIK